MNEITMADTELVGGSGLVGWALQQLGIQMLIYSYDAVVNGQVDYAGLAETQGSYYNMVGA